MTATTTSGERTGELDTHYTGRTMDSTSQSQSNDYDFSDSDALSFLRTPPTRTSPLSAIKLALAVAEVEESTKKKLTMIDEAPVKPFKRLSWATKLQVNWPPISFDSMDMKKISTKKTYYLSPKSTSATIVPLPPSVSESTSSLSSISPRIILGDSYLNKIGQSVHAQRKGIKEKIDLYESMCHNSSDRLNHLNHLNCQAYFDCDLYPTMKIRATYPDDQTQSSVHEDSQEFLSDVSVSPGHSLPLPTGCRKHRQVSYRIRLAIPDLDKSDHDVNDCDSDNEDEDEDVSVDEASDSRGGGIRGIRGFNRSSKWVSWREPGTENNNIDRGDDRDEDNITSKNNAFYTTVDEESETKSETSCGDYYYREYYRPDVWVTPIKSEDGSQKWIAKRVWDMEDMDDEEREYEVDHRCLMYGVRGLMGISEKMGITSDEWQVNIDESDPWEMTANKDSAPNLPKRTRDHCRPQLFVKKVIDVDGQYEESTSLPLDEDNCFVQLEHITDFPHLEGNVGENLTAINNLTDRNVSFDLNSDASFISLIDDFVGSDASSVSESLPTESTDDYSYQSPLEDSLGEEYYKNSRPFKHNERGFGRPDEWILPHDEYQESSKSKCNRHNERDFGRPDEWVRPNDSYQGSPEGRSLRSSVTSRIAQDKPARESSPEDDSPQSSKGCSISLDKCNNLGGDSMEAYNSVSSKLVDGEAEECRGKEYPKKKKNKKSREKSSSQVKLNTNRIQYDSDDEYKRGTPTWEKRALQQGEKESNIKLWWEF